MATYTWSIPAGNAITSSTKVKDTDNYIANTIDDLVDFVNGEGEHIGAGLTYDLVDKANSQTIAGIKTFSSAIIANGGVTGNVTGNTSGSSGSCTGNSATATKLATARTIAITGNISGSASFDGSASIEINITDATPSSHIGSGGTSHANATTSTAGFMSSTDKTKLDGVQAGAQVNSVTSVNGLTGAVTVTQKAFSVQTATTAIGNDTTVTLPSNAIMIQGYAQIYGGNNAGARLSAQIKNSSGSIIQDLNLCGTNLINGSDGGSGMTDGHSFSIFLSSNATSVRFYRSSGSANISGTVNQYLLYS